MSRKNNKRYYNKSKNNVSAQNEEVVHECNTGEVEFENVSEQMVAGENNIDDVELDKHDIDEQAMEFDKRK